MSYQSLSFDLEKLALWDKSDLRRLRLDEMLELLCRHASWTTTKDAGLTLVCDTVEVERFKSAELYRLVVHMLPAFLRTSVVRHVLIGLTQTTDSVDLTIWGQGLTAIPDVSQGQIAEVTRRLGARSTFRRSSAGAGFAVSVPVSSTRRTPHNIH